MREKTGQDFPLVWKVEVVERITVSESDQVFRSHVHSH